MGLDNDLLAASGNVGGGLIIDPATLNPFCQLIAGDIIGFNDGDTINTPWPDSSGNGHTFNPFLGVTYQENEFKGKAGVKFSNGYFDTSGDINTFAFLHLNPADSTVFVVLKIRLANPGNNQAILDSAGIDSSKRGYSLYYRDTGTPFDDAAYLGIFKGSAGFPVTNLTGEGGITTQVAQIITATFGYGRVGDDGDIAVNGVSVDSDNLNRVPAVIGGSAQPMRIGRYVLGAGLDLDAVVAEICFFDKVLNPVQRLGIKNFYTIEYV